MIVWDLPLRLFHWSFMISVFGAIISGKMGQWHVHERFGLAILGLVIFRVIWGFIGSETAKFSRFITGPKAVLRTIMDLVQKKSSSKLGHSPLGGYATIALLAIPFMMALTGAFSTDDILFDGPFYHLMPDWAQMAGNIHHFGEKLVFLIILLHLFALLYYVLRLKKNLVKPMVTGRTNRGEGVDGTLSFSRTIFGLALLVLLAGGAQFATQLRPSFF